MMNNSGIMGMANSLGNYGPGSASNFNQYDPNPQLTKALNRLAKALEDLKPRVRVKMGRSVEPVITIRREDLEVVA